MTVGIPDRQARYPIGASISRRQLSEDTGPVLARLRRHEPVSWVPAIGAWLVTDLTTVGEALRDPDTFTVQDPRFSTAQVVGTSMLSLDGAEHRRLRSPFVAPFRASQSAEQRPVVERLVDHLIDGFEPRRSAELRTELAGPLAVATITRSLGLVGADEDDVLGWYRAIVAGVVDVGEGRPVSAEARQAVDDLRAQVATTVATGRNGSSLLARIAGASDLSADELFSNVAVMMFGAIETSEGMTTNALFHLLSHPHQRAEVAADRALLDNAIEESLRLEPAAAVVDRYATTDVDLGPPGRAGRIEQGDLITLSLTGANRDPDHFDDPERFDIHRSNAAAHLAFVHGPHACIGAHLARVEAAAAISGVLDRLPAAVVDTGATTPPAGLVFRKCDRLTVRW